MAGGSFQPMVVDSHHAYVYQFLIKPFLQGNLNHFHIVLLAWALRFAGNKIT
jgi:hypothetical protein